ncbi:hypothetical protein COCON_G00092660 [Conger conger]|uniref:Uncharacterized protein n=1 Tax=Conger conger TaxID=82655 RepID=A0A9Q1I0B3_CONCO|nr:hypothetical protein COCON_G00092660 [Conger conger]
MYSSEELPNSGCGGGLCEQPDKTSGGAPEKRGPPCPFSQWINMPRIGASPQGLWNIAAPAGPAESPSQVAFTTETCGADPRPASAEAGVTAWCRKGNPRRTAH